MKTVKILIKVAVVVVALAVVALLTLPLWFGPVVKTVANSVAPNVVKTDFHLGHLSLNPYVARFELGDMQLSNPAGYSEKYAATVGEVVFDADTFSLLSDVIHVEEIKVKDVFVSVVSKDGVGNFKQIQYNMAGGKDQYEAKNAEAEAKQSADVEKLDVQKPELQKPAETSAEPKAKKPSKKVIIDHLEISGIKMQLGILPISIPVTISLHDIGKDSKGASFEEVWSQIVTAVMKAAGAIGDQFMALGGMAGDAATKAVGQAAEAASKVADQATAVVGGAASMVGEGAGKVGEGVKAVGDGVKSVGDGVMAVGEGTGKVVGEGVKAVGDGVKAVGEGAGKALDSLKKLW